MSEPERNAFDINRLNGGFFPLSLKVTRTAGITRASMCAQRVIDCADLIAASSTGHLAVFGLEQYSVFDEVKDVPLPLAGLARRAGAPVTAIDEDTIVIPAGQLSPLLNMFFHASLTMFDLPPDWEENALIRGVLACRNHDWSGDAPLLPELTGSRFYAASYDDCYMMVESLDTRLSRQIFARMLELYTTAVLGKTDIGAVPDELVDAFWREDFGLTVLRESVEVTPTGLRIGVARKPFNFKDDEAYPVDFYLTYDAVNRAWG
jgi:hypothetical protein